MRCRPLAAIQESQTYKKRRRMKKLVISEQWTRDPWISEPSVPLLHPLGSIYRERGGGCFYYFHWCGQELHPGPSYLHSRPPNHTTESLDITIRSSTLTKMPLYPFFGLFYTQWGP
jgi:hypothetical protein